MKNRLLIIDDEQHTCEMVSGFWQVLKNNSGLGETWDAGSRERSPYSSQAVQKGQISHPSNPGAPRRALF
jgi:hypothetical protein